MGSIESHIKKVTNNKDISDELRRSIEDYVYLKTDEVPERVHSIMNRNDFDAFINDLSKCRQDERESYKRLLILYIHNNYEYRETNTYNISSKDLVNKINASGKHALYIPDFDECAKYLKDNVKENDIVTIITLFYNAASGCILLKMQSNFFQYGCKVFLA